MNNSVIRACNIINDYIRENFPEVTFSYNPAMIEDYPFLQAVAQFLETLHVDVNEMTANELVAKYSIEEEYGKDHQIEQILKEFTLTHDIEKATESLYNLFDEINIDDAHVEVIAKKVAFGLGAVFEGNENFWVGLINNILEEALSNAG